MLIPAGVVALVSVLATLVMLAKKHYENAFTRFCVAVFYTALAVMPAVSIETGRLLNRYFWVLVLGVEILWWCVRQWITWRRNGH